MTATESPEARLVHRHGRDPLPAGGPQMAYTVLELSAAGDGESAVAPLNICLLLDQSRSMQGEKMTRVREAARQIAASCGQATRWLSSRSTTGRPSSRRPT